MTTSGASLLGEQDLHLFGEGTHRNAWRVLGAHVGADSAGVSGTHFAVWAPNATSVNVIGDWNGWGDHPSNSLQRRAESGVWEGFARGVGVGAAYQFRVRSFKGGVVDKADPFGFLHQVAPGTASVVAALDYEWHDESWMNERGPRIALSAPVSIYEVHLGSWMRVPHEQNRSLTYREVAPKLAAYAKSMGFTHIELMPITEHPFFGSWGYQTTGYFAPTSRYASSDTTGPQDFMFFVDTLHQAGIGVILDWVPSHFPTDAHGLSLFDGTALFEHEDERQGFHPDWKSSIFNYGRHEVVSFLRSSAHFWLDAYHLDGLRVDAVASMLHLDYSRKEGEWIRNKHGGRENLEAVAFLRSLNESVYAAWPDVQTIAEDSTSWPMVSRPLYLGGLGFGFKWDLGWMHDTLGYFQHDPVHRKYHHRDVTFRAMYATSENFMLPLSHDEVVHGKGSLYGKMPGDRWQKLANLRLLLGSMFAQPGKKLLFMGGELGQEREWNHDSSLDWHLLGDGRGLAQQLGDGLAAAGLVAGSEAVDEQRAGHRGVQRLVTSLNRIYRAETALHELDCDARGFQWIEANDADRSILSFLRWGKTRTEAVVVVCNFTPLPHQDMRIGVPWGGFWEEILNSDANEYGGGGWGNFGGVAAVALPSHGHRWSISATLPPLAIVFLRGRAP